MSVNSLRLTKSPTCSQCTIAALSGGIASSSSARSHSRTSLGFSPIFSLPSAWKFGSPSRNRIRSARDRKSVGEGKSVSVRVDLGGRRSIKKKDTRNINKYNKQQSLPVH